ncbi:chemotaxis protein CheW [uncultured Algimonas sp.]|uniref:chemotaxis protein CheW n=1 Tax=uncultured Algimonas sp. TaxID=1547920 RepID=UPI00261325E3|nr:chemotaxis protein CheW [uncultured Algimonas sp.]
MGETGEETNRAEFVTFTVGEQRFCIDIMSLREIRGWSPATPLPDTPDYVLGVVNLRGTVLPIIDLAERFGLPGAEPNARSIIMITNVDGKLAGLLADSVSDIITIDPSEVQAAPNYKEDSRSMYVAGLVARDDEMIGLVSLPDVVGHQALVAA